MIFLKRLFVLLYMLLMVLTGLLYIVLALHLYPSVDWMEMLNIVYESTNSQIAMGVVGAFFILTGLTSYLRAVRKLNRNRMITFQNPDGEVTVTVAAVEEFIRKVAKDIPNIVNVRCRVRYHRRKGLHVISDVVISAGTSIPSVTEKIQMEVKNKVHTMLGIEDKVTITTNVKKITGEVPRGDEKLEDDNEPFQIPFR